MQTSRWTWLASLIWFVLFFFCILFPPPILWAVVALCVCSSCLFPFLGRGAYAAVGVSLFLLMVSLLDQRGLDRTARLVRTQTLLATLRLGSQMYEKEYGRDPEGDLASVRQLLEGENPKGIPFVDLASNSIDDQGQIIDAWKTPIQFERRQNLLIFTSAGPDRAFGTVDDLTSVYQK